MKFSVAQACGNWIPFPSISSPLRGHFFFFFIFAFNQTVTLVVEKKHIVIFFSIAIFNWLHLHLQSDWPAQIAASFSFGTVFIFCGSCDAYYNFNFIFELFLFFSNSFLSNCTMIDRCKCITLWMCMCVCFFFATFWWQIHFKKQYQLSRLRETCVRACVYIWS